MCQRSWESGIGAGQHAAEALHRESELWRTRFDYRQETVFNAATYLGFLEQLAGGTAVRERF